MLFTMLVATPSLAQQQPAATPTPQEQILGSTIGSLFVENSRLVVEVAKLKAEIERLMKEKSDVKEEKQK